MEELFFEKYKKIILKTKNTEDFLLLLIKNKTGVFLKKEEIKIIGKKIKIQTSSIKKTNLLLHKIKEVLSAAGFSLIEN